MSDATAKTALEELRRRVVGAVNRACPAWGKSDRDDLVQCVLTALLARFGDLEGNHRFPSTYLEKMAYGVMVDELRRRGRRKELPLDHPATAERPAANPGPERLMESTEIAAGIRDCVARLSPDRRLAVRLHLLGCAVPEIARRTGWPAKRAENLLYRGLAEVRNCLAARGFAP